MSKMVVLPKTTLYIGWLVCVLVIPVGYENEKRARTRQRRAGGVNKHPLPCTKARQGVFVLGLFRGDRAGERLPLFRG